MTSQTPFYEIEDDEEAGMPVVNVRTAEALLVLSEMAIERGVTRVADLGNLPPLDPETKAKYLVRARNRAREVERDAS